MPHLIPFRALRYAPAAGRLEHLLAPPYDVIDEELARELRQADPHNAVRLVLPEGAEDRRYARAAADLVRWMEQGVLAEDSFPSVTVYRQRFVADSGPRARIGLFAALKLVPFSQGAVLPHEATHAGPRRDRLALMKATRAQLSPVFLLARDADASLLRELAAAAESPPDLRACTGDGVEHEAWIVRDRERAERLCVLAGQGPLLVADGHHRYETALEASRCSHFGDSPHASHTLAFVVSSGDLGIVVRPTHRTLSRPPPGADSIRRWLEDPPPGFRASLLGASAGTARAARERRTDRESVGWVVLVPADGGAQRWELSAEPATLAELGVSKVEARIDAITFQRAVLEGCYGTTAEAAARGGWLTYHRDAETALAAAGEAGGAFLLSAVAVDDVWRCAEIGRVLPPKTTYFEPKIPSGLVFRRL